jgi:magnesium-transporting ATPase (P-type)
MNLCLRFFLILVGGFQLMVWGGALLCFIVFGLTPDDIQTLALGVVLVLIVLVTSTFQLVEEMKSDSVVAALKAMSPTRVWVYRDGSLIDTDAVSLVPGDVVKVNTGEKVPADMRVLTASDLKVNQASLTGENIDIKLGPEAGHARFEESKNVCRSGCSFTSGSGLCVVFATGDNTVFGRIARATLGIERPPTTLRLEIERFIRWMSILAFTLGGISKTNGYSWVEAIVFMIGIVIANVPEGLLPQMTVALSETAKRMLKRGVLVNNLEIIETLGAVTVICSDKTYVCFCFVELFFSMFHCFWLFQWHSDLQPHVGFARCLQRRDS